MFEEKADYIVHEILKLSKEELASVMELKGNLLEEVYQVYKGYNRAHYECAIKSYSGREFKEIDRDNYKTRDWTFLQKHLVILSALYGALKPLDGIKPYRLDLRMKVIHNGLYSYWYKDINELLKDEDLIINLASSEFSKLVKLPMTSIEFKEKQEDGSFKIRGTYAKKARGLMVNYIVKDKITKVNSIKKFNLEGYVYNKDLSEKKNLVFTRDKGVSNT